jgi:hypothetical protein
MGIFQHLSGFVAFETIAWPSIFECPSLQTPVISLDNYSRRTVCPECNSRVRLEDVRFTPTFPCPSCGKNVRVSDRYERILKWLGLAMGLMLPYGLGVRSWFLLVSWLPHRCCSRGRNDCSYAGLQGEICSVEIVRGAWCSPAEPALPSFLCLLDVGGCRSDIPTAFPHMTGAGDGAIRPEF